MNLYLDINSRNAITGIGVASPLQPITFKDQDTPGINIYFVLEGKVQDEGSGTAIKFGLNLPPPNPISLLVYDTSFTRQTDTNGNVFYQGFPAFYTTQLAAALGNQTSLQCVGEVRTQLSDGEIWRSMDISFTIWRTILLETTTPPPSIVNTYPDASTLEIIPHKGIAGGYAELDSGAKLLLSRIPAGVELSANRNVANGYPSLDANALLNPAQIPIDGATIYIDTATHKLVSVGPSLGSVALTTSAFTAPAAGGNVTIAVPTTQLLPGVFYLISTAGYYKYVAAVDSNNGTFTNPGSVGNAAPGTVITYGQTLTITGAPGPPGTTTGVASLSDAIASPGQSLIYASSGVLRRLIQGTNVTLDAATTPGGIIISAASGGSGVAALTDAETTTGFTLIYNSTGVLLRLISQDTSIVITNNGQTLGIKTGLADAETSTGVTLLGATNGQIKRLIAGTNVTLDPATTPGGVIINAAAGGGGVASLTDAETSAGVTIISSSTGVLKRLVAGANITLTPDSPTAGGVTIASSGGSGGFAPNHTQAIRNVAWTYADATVIPWTGVNWDTDTKWALTPNPSRLTIVTAGYYQVTVQLAFTPAAGSGTIEVNVTVNGGTHPRIGTQSILNGSVNPGSMLISGVLKLNAADYVEVFPLMQTGAAPTALAYVSTGIGNPYGPFFQLDYLGT